MFFIRHSSAMSYMKHALRTSGISFAFPLYKESGALDISLLTNIDTDDDSLAVEIRIQGSILFVGRMLFDICLIS